MVMSGEGRSRVEALSQGTPDRALRTMPRYWSSRCSSSVRSSDGWRSREKVGAAMKTSNARRGARDGRVSVQQSSRAGPLATYGADMDQRISIVTLGVHDLGRSRRFYEDLGRSEEHTSELQSLMRISYAVFCLKKKK